MSTDGHAVNLKQYRRIGAKWQFVPVVEQNGKPNPKLVLVQNQPVSSKGRHLLPGLEGKRQAPHAARRHHSLRGSRRMGAADCNPVLGDGGAGVIR